LFSSANPALSQTPLTPIIGVSSLELDFGTIPLGSPSYLNDELFNATPDSHSVLNVTAFVVEGDGFTIFAPPDSLNIPGDGSSVVLPIRFQPTSSHTFSGTLRITANAPNSPFDVTLTGRGIEDELFTMAVDADSIPILCGTTGTTPPPGGDDVFITRGWECIPSVIRNDGADHFIIEVDTSAGPVNGVNLIFESTKLTYPALPGTPPYSIPLSDDGLGNDRVAGDGIYTSDRFYWNPAVAMDGYMWADFLGLSPQGLQLVRLGRVIVQEVDQTTTEFQVAVDVGVLRQDISAAAVTIHSPTISSSSHVINIVTTNHTVQRTLRFLNPGLEPLTNAIYGVFPDITDFFMLLSTDKLERVPSQYSNVAGLNHRVQVNYAGTGLIPFDDTEDFGSHGRLLAVNLLDYGSRGLSANNAVHELLHQWAAYIDPFFGLTSGGHYRTQSNLGSLVGGHEWVDNGNGTYSINCFWPGTRATALDRYLAGLITGSGVGFLAAHRFEAGYCSIVGPGDLVANPTIEGIQHDPVHGHGVRFPSPLTSQKNFTFAFVAESHGRAMTATEMTFYNILAEHFTRILPPETQDPPLHPQNQWRPMTRYFGEGTTWRSDYPLLPPIAIPVEEPGHRPVLVGVSPTVFSSETLVKYSLPGPTQVRITVYDIAGRLIRELLRGVQGPGDLSITWNARDHSGRKVPAGVYFYRLEAGGLLATGPLVVVK
jgi:hypothetical protein